MEATKEGRSDTRNQKIANWIFEAQAKPVNQRPAQDCVLCKLDGIWKFGIAIDHGVVLARLGSLGS